MVSVAYGSIALQLTTLDPKLFSISTLKPYLLPCVIVSILLSIGHIVVTHFKIEKMHKPIMHKTVSLLTT